MIWGVDLGVRSCHMVGLPEGQEQGPLVFSIVVDKSNRWDELQVITRQFQERVLVTDQVFIEEPPLAGSRNVRTFLALAQTSGALLAVSAGRSYLVPVSKWKQEVIGRGSASKEMVGAWLAESEPDLCMRCADQNLMDAACIAIYGQQIVESAQARKNQ